MSYYCFTSTTVLHLPWPFWPLGVWSRSPGFGPESESHMKETQGPICFIWTQGHSHEFTKRGQTRGSGGRNSPAGSRGRIYETLENTNGAVTKIDLRWWGDMHPCPPPWLCSSAPVWTSV